MSFIYLAVAFTFNSVANIFLKLKAKQGLQIAGHHGLELITQNYQLFLGMIFFAANFFFYYLALRDIQLSLAYPIMVVASFLIINSYAIFFLGEKINLMQILGYLFIVAGIILVFYFAKNNQ